MGRKEKERVSDNSADSYENNSARDYDPNSSDPWGWHANAAAAASATSHSSSAAQPSLLSGSSANSVPQIDINDTDITAFITQLFQKLSSIEEINKAVIERQSIKRKGKPISITEANNNELFDAAGNWINAKECHIDSGNFNRIIGFLQNDLDISDTVLTNLSDKDKIILEAVCFSFINGKISSDTSRLTELASNDLKNAQHHFAELGQVKDRQYATAKAAVLRLEPHLKHIINHTEPFTQYLLERPAALIAGIDEGLSDTLQLAKASRTFNPMTDQYKGVQHLINCVADAVNNDKYEDWGYLSLFTACHDMLDDKGKLKPSLIRLLNQNGNLANFYLVCGDKETNTQLIAAYHVMIATASAGQEVDKLFRPAVIDENTDMTQSKSRLFSMTQTNLCNTGIGSSITPDSIAQIHKRLVQIANDPKYPAKKLQNAVREMLYNNAVSRLEQAIEQSDNKQIKNTAASVLKEAKQAAIKSPENRPAITNAIQAATAVVKNPDNLSRIDMLQKQAQKISHRSWGKMLGGSMLALAGTAFAVGCTAVALFSFGALAPISILGFTLGVSMVAGGIAVGVGAVGLTAGSMGTTMFASGVTQGSRTGQLRSKMETLAKQAKPRS